MTEPVHPAIRRYVDGEISALRTAALLGNDVTVADVFMMVRAAGLEPPRQTPEKEQAELARARHVLGID